MSDDEIFYTATMAKIFTSQGNLSKAAEIYRYLLEKEPQRQDLINALREIRKEMERQAPEHLVTLVKRWVHLVVKYKYLRKKPIYC